MVIFIHVIIALTSVIQSTFLLFVPSQKKLTVTYILFGGTIASGTYVLFTIPSHMLQTCIDGLLYMGFVVGAVVVAKIRLAKKSA